MCHVKRDKASLINNANLRMTWLSPAVLWMSFRWHWWWRAGVGKHECLHGQKIVLNRILYIVQSLNSSYPTVIFTCLALSKTALCVYVCTVVNWYPLVGYVGVLSRWISLYLLGRRMSIIQWQAQLNILLIPMDRADSCFTPTLIISPDSIFTLSYPIV